MKKKKTVPLQIFVTASYLRRIVKSRTSLCFAKAVGRLSLELQQIPSPAMQGGIRWLETRDQRGFGENTESPLHSGDKNNAAHTGRSTYHILAGFCYYVHVEIPKPGERNKD